MEPANYGRVLQLVLTQAGASDWLCGVRAAMKATLSDDGGECLAKPWPDVQAALLGRRRSAPRRAVPALLCRP